MKPSDIALLMLGSPVIKVELDEKQLQQIQEYVELVVNVFGVEPDLKELAIIDGVTAYAKYVVGRIRSKYRTMPSAGDKDLELDGHALVYEALEEIDAWRERFLK